MLELPSPKFQLQLVAPTVELVKETSKGAKAMVGEPAKATSGGGIAAAM